MLHAFLTYINEQKLFEPSEKVLLTVSGGKDSVAMLDLFCGANILFAVAHCNFQLRGRDSDEDQLFVENLCKENNVVFHTKTFDTKAYAKKNKISIEMAARTLRYEWFESLRKELNFDYIATAHHLNDSIETVLLNLTKGTGISGLKGISAKKGHIIRPMLFASRQEIDAYVAKKKLSWREDSSNASNDYQRNLIRNQVVPLLKKINPNLDETFARNLERFQSLEADFRKNLSHFKATVMREENGVFFLKIANIRYWQSANYYLEELLKEFGFNYFQSKEIFNSLDGLSGKVFHAENFTLLKDREELVITAPQQWLPPQPLPDKEGLCLQINNDSLNTEQSFEFLDKKLRFTVLNIEEIDSKFERNNTILFADFDKIMFPITFRTWQEGDWFIPLGMKGKKKISDFLIDKKISLNLKKNIFLLTSQDAVIWVAGQRADDRFKLTDTTKKILKVEIM
ncbi:tRNA(Ile)-lysidine synthase [Emticicia aquatilis]|uniref:tRNA(Ile)-lysidine synthase n=1 Tax=Emticicia aquatilis TaxID=1537369 RepID=A0A916Z1P0_9BACT|nr:tRNA lysidine(34) synthetase TilS [Emticicia aquatilis]GGD71845.1 tRNA(Ile)-lysidine synthase [Emticicia aquatilis]